MLPRSTLLALVLACCAVSGRDAAKTVTPPPSHPIAVSAATTAAFLTALKATPTAALHGIAELERDPTPADREALAQRGITLLSFLAGRLYRVRVAAAAAAAAAAADSAGSALPAPIRGLSLLEPVDRVAPALWARRYDAYHVRVAGRREAVNYVLAAGDSLKLTVFFQAGIPDSTVTRVLAQHGQAPRRIVDGTWLLTASAPELAALAAEDAVRWIGPGAPPFAVDNDKTRAAVGVDELQDFSLGLGAPKDLSGSGVQVGVYDLGIDETHRDFREEFLGYSSLQHISLTAPERSLHGTMVAGVIGGSGLASWGKDSWSYSNGGTPFQWRGMAPRVEMLEVVPQAKWDGSFLFDGAAHLALIRDHGMDLSNHSHDADGDGTYGAVSSTLDAVIRGDASVGAEAIPPRLQVFSAGNYGALGYLTLRKQLKNALVVGNWYVGPDRVNGYSSLGPTDDGRIKPDLLAPGTKIHSTGFWDLNSPEDYGAIACLQLPDGSPPASVTIRRDFYAQLCGTSMAAPVVTGASALVLEQYAKTYKVDLDKQPPSPATLRGLLIHGARDATGDWPAPENVPGFPVKAYPGPDYASGWGLLDAAASVELVKGWEIIEDNITAPCATRTYPLKLLDPLGAGGAVSAKVTLTWDDPAGDPALPRGTPLLVNDLDLVLIDPAGAQHYPWRLNQTITDGGGNPVAPKDEVCGSTLKVTRQLSYGIAPAQSLIVPAENGTDHLNNVEQVVATGPEGDWQAVVTGFRLATAEQKFSLIGIPREVFSIPIDQVLFCKLVPFFCTKHVGPICVRYPKLCERHRPIRIDPGDLRVEFAAMEDRVVIPFAPLCGYLISAAACRASERPVRYAISLGSSGVAVGAVLFDSAGVRVAGDSIPAAAHSLSFSALPGQRYVLLLYPGPEVRPGETVRLPIRIEALRP